MIIKKFIKGSVPIAVTILAAFFTSILPINLGFIPPDKVYGISLTVYSSIGTILFKGIFSIVNWVKNRKSYIIIKFSDRRSTFEELEIVKYDFESGVDITKIYFKVLLEGSPKKFLGKKIEIVLPIQVEAHSMDKYSDNCCISEDKKTITVDVNKLFNKNKKKRIEDSQVLGFKVLKNYPEVESGLEVSIINNNKKKVKLVNNTGFFRK